MTNQLLNLDKYVHSSTPEYNSDFNIESIRCVALVSPDGLMRVFQINSEDYTGTVELSEFFDVVDDQQENDYDFHDHVLILVKDHEVVSMVLRYIGHSTPVYNYPDGYLITDPLPQDWIDELNVARVKALIGDAL